ncbi:unnamed protein product [Phytophthora lilii]|uniref:Unnamed protein product n=1 Tax=Phytophthora lilii TaxID=2077276 RepID=A0A9W6XF19_9STRA|nr:unnamed protein product [Phytophthora lilii]
MKNAANQEIVNRACQVWSSENSALFPTEFRQVSLAYALISKRQRDAYEAEKVAVRRDLTQLKQVLQRKCVEAKVRYDHEIRGSSFEPTLMRRLSSMETADSRYDEDRRVLLFEIQEAVDKLRDSERPRFIPEAAILNILSFCGRHWFDVDPQRPRLSRKKKTKKTAETKALMMSGAPPTTYRPHPDQLPKELEAEFNSFQHQLKELCDQLQATVGNENFDTANGVSKDANGASLATLDVFVEQGENLPLRDRRIGDMVRDDNRPKQKSAVPSIQKELSVQVVDSKREDVAGEVIIPLRSLLDQKDHSEWHVMPPTLRQQILEKKPRDRPARVRVSAKLTHTKVKCNSAAEVPIYYLSGSSI